MRKTHATVLSLTLLSLSATVARAADEGPTISGFVDTTYNYNTNRSPTDTNVAHSFDNQSNTFDLNMAELLIQGNPKGDKDVGYTFRLAYGSDADKINGVDNTGASLSTGSAGITVEEAFGTWRDPGTKFGVKIGKFVTFEGIEVIESIADPTITRGLLFSFAEPFTHTGALATYQANDNLDFALGLVNGWDQVRDINHSKTIVGKATWSDGAKCGATASFLYGPEKAGNTADNRFSFDLTGVSHHIDKLDLNAQINYGQEEKSDVTDPNKTGKWWGLGVQPVYHLDKKFFIGARLEYFITGSTVQLTAPGAEKTNMFTVSVAPGYQVTEHFLARVEARIDHANKEIFEDKTGAAVKKSQFELAAEAIFSF